MRFLFLGTISTLSICIFCLFSCTNEKITKAKTQEEELTHTLNSASDQASFFDISAPQIDSMENTDTMGSEVLPTPELQLFVFESAASFGYKNEAGEVVLNAQYKMASEFVNGMAEVVDEKGWAYVNGRGEVIARPFVYDNGPDYFKEGLARFVEANQIGFLNENGQKVIAAQFDFARPFSDGRSAACMGCKKKKFVTESGEHFSMEGGKWGFIDTAGNWITPCVYDEVRDFEKGSGAYLDNGNWVAINKQGEVQ